MSLDAALNVSCPTCHAKAGQPCRSRRAISIHQGRREALADLGTQASRLLAASQKPPRTIPPTPVLIGVTGDPVPDGGDERPPWD